MRTLVLILALVLLWHGASELPNDIEWAANAATQEPYSLMRPDAAWMEAFKNTMIAPYELLIALALLIGSLK
jgi:hypothetical protein